MTIKTENEIWFIKPGDVIIVKAASSRVTLVGDGKTYVLESYVNRDRAKEVYDEIWDAIKTGQDWYEMPEI